jgi:hypothetical protein
MKVTVSQLIEVDLKSNEIKQISKEFLKTFFNWSDEYQIETDESGVSWVYKVLKGYSSHVFEYKEIVRKATEDDIVFYKVFQKII